MTKIEDELHKPYFDVKPFYYFMDRARLQRQIEREFGYVQKPEQEESEPLKKEPRWFVVHDDAYDTYVSEHHTKKEALKDMKGSLSSCWLIKGKIVK